jgi:hypothetical protein
LAPFAFPVGGEIVSDVGPGDADCVHQAIVGFPGGFSSPVFCVPGLNFTVEVAQTACGIGLIDSDGGSDFTVNEIGDTSDSSPVCNLPHPGCVDQADSSVRVDVTVGDGVPDTCQGAGTADVVVAIPVFSTTWLEFSSGFSCPANDGTFDPGAPMPDTLVTAFPQILDFTTDTATSSWADIDGDGCFLAGAGPAGGFSAKGRCMNFVNKRVWTVATGSIGSDGAPLGDLGFLNILPNNVVGPNPLTGATCASPPVINFDGVATRCLSE